MSSTPRSAKRLIAQDLIDREGSAFRLGGGRKSEFAVHLGRCSKLPFGEEIYRHLCHLVFQSGPPTRNLAVRTSVKDPHGLHVSSSRISFGARRRRTPGADEQWFCVHGHAASATLQFFSFHSPLPPPDLRRQSLSLKASNGESSDRIMLTQSRHPLLRRARTG